MPNAIEFVKLVKKAAIEAVEAERPVNVCYGIVESTIPLKINVEQKMTLGENQLILTQNVTNYEVTICEKETEGKKEIIIQNELVEGDKVILVRKQGGQKYIVWDRMVEK